MTVATAATKTAKTTKAPSVGTGPGSKSLGSGASVLFGEALACIAIITVTDVAKSIKTGKSSKWPSPGAFFAIGIIYIGIAMVSGGNGSAAGGLGAIPVATLLIQRGVGFFEDIGKPNITPIAPHTGAPVTVSSSGSGSSVPFAAAVGTSGGGPLFPSLTGVSVGRTDYGVDFSYSQPTPAYAIASGTVARLGSGWRHVNAPYQTGQAVYIKLDQPIGGYNYMYYAEGTPIGNLRVGDRVTPGQQIMINPGEIGIIPTPTTGTLFQTPQPSGTLFHNFLKTIGAIP